MILDYNTIVRAVVIAMSEFLRPRRSDLVVANAVTLSLRTVGWVILGYLDDVQQLEALSEHGARQLASIRR